ncbi:MAG TPA: tetratricopeptide repeat protein, partial [Blastocatellia bacterium]|nr:tetratricopeptide repeat protein [Blastocatellia bacterium]
PIRTMWDEVEQRKEKWELTAIHRALLDNHRGKLFARLEQPERAAEEFKKGLEDLGQTDDAAIREYLVDGLAAASAMFAFGGRNYPQAISVARLALSYDPRHRTAKHMAVLGYLGLKDFDSAHQLLNELIVAYPDAIEFRSGRYTAYLAENRKEEAEKELAEILRIRPSFAEDAVKSILGQSDPKFHKALAEWGQDVGWNTGGQEELLRLQQLPEEVLTELMTAQFKLMATTPTPDQVVSLRELFASRLPDWPSLQIQLGSAYLAVGRVLDAVAAFERARAISPDDPSILSVSALALSSFGHIDEAEPFLKASASLLSDNPGPDLLMISNLLDRGRTNDAREHAEITMKKFPDKSMVRWLYGAVLLQIAGEEQKGWTEMKAAYRADPTVIETTIKGWSVRPPEALDKLRQTIASEAGGEISEILASLPSDEMLRLYMEIVRARLEADAASEPNPDVLIPPLEELLTHRPNSIELRFMLANQYRRAGKPERAIPLLTEVLARASSEEAQMLHSVLYGLYLKTGEYRLSLEQLQKLERPGEFEYHVMATLHEQFGEFREALAASDKAIAASENALKPATDEEAAQIGRYALYNLTAGRLDRAEELLRAQLSRQPDADDPIALSNLAEILFSRGGLREARTAALRSLDLDATSALATARMARISEAMKLEEEAERYRAQALQRLPGASDYDQACALAVLGREEEALARLRDAIKGDPTLKGWANCDPDFRAFHGNSEFRRIVSV